MLPPFTCILLLCFFTSSSLPYLIDSAINPEDVVQEVLRKVNESVSRRYLLSSSDGQCATGNPIDDCWRCDPNWSSNRKRLADCAIGFGQSAIGGKDGAIYEVVDPSDDSAENPKMGTLRYAAIQVEPLWIVFSANMTIKLRHQLIVSSYTTIDGRGANVQITGAGCILIQSVSNVIIHNLHIYKCIPSKKEEVRLSPTKEEPVSESDGDGITVRMSSNIWIDHCDLSMCTDGLIDVTEGSTSVTISNNQFSHHDKVMLLGHSDADTDDDMIQVTVAFNRFGEKLGQRMPRCRRGYFHVFNNDYTSWEFYAIGGSHNPTINSQGNRFTAPARLDVKEVTKRINAERSEWLAWNWKSTDDAMVNGAFFVPSGDGGDDIYAKASSTGPKSVDGIVQLTRNVGVLSGTGLVGGGESNVPGVNEWDGKMVIEGGAPPQSVTVAIIWAWLLVVITFYHTCIL